MKQLFSQENKREVLLGIFLFLLLVLITSTIVIVHNNNAQHKYTSAVTGTEEEVETEPEALHIEIMYASLADVGVEDNEETYTE